MHFVWLLSTVASPPHSPLSCTIQLVEPRHALWDALCRTPCGTGERGGGVAAIRRRSGPTPPHPALGLDIPMAGHNPDGEALEDEGMQDPVVLRGLLQCIAIAFFFSSRYLLDVLFTPHVHVVQAVPQQLLALAHQAWTAAWCAPAMSLVLLHYWGSLEYGLFSLLARWLLRFCILRSLVVKLMDDDMVVWRLRKVHIWTPLQCLVTFTRVSSGREQARGEWRGGGSSFALPCDAMGDSIYHLLRHVAIASSLPKWSLRATASRL